MDRLMTALRRPDGPGTADITRAGVDHVVAPLPKRLADRVDGGEVEHVESHSGDARELGFEIAKRSQRPRKQLVPGAEGRLRAIDFDRVVAIEPGGKCTVGIPPHQIEQLVAAHVVHLVGDLVVSFEHRYVVFQPFAIASLGMRRSAANHLQPDAELHLQIGWIALLQVAVPGEKVIDPRLDGEEIEAELGDRQLRAPTIVHQRSHSSLFPAGLALMAMRHHSREDIVAIGKDVGLDRYDVAGDPLRRKTAVIHGRRHTFNDDTATAVKYDFRHESASVRTTCPVGERRAARGER